MCNQILVIKGKFCKFFGLKKRVEARRRMI